MMNPIDEKRLVVCIDNTGNEASLDKWKIYQSLPDGEAERHNEIRVIDEEGEDYLYPSDCFSPVFLEAAIEKMFLAQQQANKAMD